MNSMGFLKGMGAGLLVGACVGMVVAPDKRARKRQIGRAVKAMGQIMEDFSGYIKF